MANPDIGTIICPHCKGPAAVRRQKDSPIGKLYYNCPSCGVVRIPYKAGQEWILNNATIYGPDGPPEDAPVPAPAPPPPPPPEPAPAPKPTPPAKRAPAPAAAPKKSLLDEIL